MIKIFSILKVSSKLGLTYSPQAAGILILGIALIGRHHHHCTALRLRIIIFLKLPLKNTCQRGW